MYSVLAFAVSQRTHEFGIRMALGARPGHLLGMVVLQGMGLTLAGLCVGAAAGVAAARGASGFLVNVSAGDPLVLSGAAGFLALVALLASSLPALRAMRVDPHVALRQQ
jgi:putative ABC transport system permease protein